MSYVLLLKSSRDTNAADTFSLLLEKNGLKAICLPILDVQFINENLLINHLENSNNLSALIFTSQNAVDAVRNIFNRGNYNNALNLPSYVVGKKTGLSASSLGFKIHGESSGNAENLSEIISNDYMKEEKPLLFLCGNLRKDTLPKKLISKGIKYEELVIYETCKNANFSNQLSHCVNHNGMPSHVVFFSPSGVEYSFPIFNELNVDLEKVKVISIGPTTSEALALKNIDVAFTAQTPSPEGILQAFQSFTGT